MELDTGTNQLIPLPEFPQRYASGSSMRGGVGFRRFGIVEDDLRVDFAAINRAALATRLLDICAVDRDRVLPENFFRELSVGKRIECLLVLALGGADDTLRFPFKCSGCGEDLELELTLDEIAAFQNEADQVEVVSVDLSDRRLEFHKLSGRDQEAIGESAFSDEFEAATVFIGRLAVDADAVKPLAARDIEVIEAAMEEADPLVNFNCRIDCGECGQSNDHEIDLFETALDMLRRAQLRLVLSVHRIASKYHWSEREIFAVPEWRRQQYLELIGAKA
jgi:hypothetical protein